MMYVELVAIAKKTAEGFLAAIGTEKVVFFYFHPGKPALFDKILPAGFLNHNDTANIKALVLFDRVQIRQLKGLFTTNGTFEIFSMFQSTWQAGILSWLIAKG